MNRTDEISAVARDIAEQIAPAPEQRDVIADNLVKLVSLVVAAVGKSVAGAGEGDLNDAHGAEFFLDTGADAGDESQQRAEFEREKELDCAKAHGMYITGERIQDGARWVQEEAVTADLDRWPDGQGWTSKLPPVPTDETLASQHEIASQLLLSQGAADPFAPGELTQLAHQAADDMREQHKTPVADERPLFAPGAEEYYRKALGLGPKPCDAQDCLAHGDAGRVGPCVRDEPVKTPAAEWPNGRCRECDRSVLQGHMDNCSAIGHVCNRVTSLDGDDRPDLGPDGKPYVICGICGRLMGPVVTEPVCGWLPGDATTACDWDRDCPVHGVAAARQHIAATDAPTVLHTWVTATDGDTGATLDYVHCGVCGVRKCDGGCGDATVGAAPDVDCTTHGNDVARQCVERCAGCGDPVDNGRAHGPNQGFGGCV